MQLKGGKYAWLCKYTPAGMVGYVTTAAELILHEYSNVLKFKLWTSLCGIIITYNTLARKKN